MSRVVALILAVVVPIRAVEAPIPAVEAPILAVEAPAVMRVAATLRGLVTSTLKLAGPVHVTVNAAIAHTAAVITPIRVMRIQLVMSAVVIPNVLSRAVTSKVSRR